MIASGGHQNIYGQNNDAFLVKFDPDGVRQWGTYYGGAQEDLGWSCAADRSGNVYLSGTTSSPTAIASGGHQNSYADGTKDAFLVKFGPEGDRIWATYYGGSSIDDGFHCTTDTLNNVYLTGQTRSPQGIAFNGHLNTLPGSGDDNGFVAKFDSEGTRIWATYYGGTELDNAQAAAVDLSGNVYTIAGSSLSMDGIASNGHQNTHGGGTFEAYLVKFDAMGIRQWATYYGGPGLDQGWGCAVDLEGNVYLAGISNSASAIAMNGHQTIHAGSMDAYLVKFDSMGIRLWATYYGGDLADEGYSCVTDQNGDVYLAGLSQSATGVASGGHQNENASPGTSDAFLAKFDGSGMRLWGTYYGGTASDAGFSCTADGLGSVYLTGLTYSSAGIGADGHQNSFGGGYDGFLVKFEGGISTLIDDTGTGETSALTIYPNPIPTGGSLLTINGVPDGMMITIDIYDAQGKLLMSDRWISSGTSIKIPIHRSIGSGLYTIMVHDGQNRMKGKLVVE